jgi:hypothetical protein
VKLTGYTLILEDENETLVKAPVDISNPLKSVEPVLDSSRSFLVRVSDGQKLHFLIGMGFVERNDAFNFSPALLTCTSASGTHPCCCPSTNEPARARKPVRAPDTARESSFSSNS